MERIIIGYEGFEYINSDLSTTVYGGGIWSAIVNLVKKHCEQFLLGFIEGWTGQEIVSSLSR